jgi:TonB-linked SusC/RagA family outer membrane protein
MKNYYLVKTRKLFNLFSRGILAAMLVSFSLSFANAQDRTVSGTILDENGEGLPGVNVIIKGTSTGTVTDLDGGYRVSVPEGGTLVFSSIGFTTQEVAVGSQSVIDVTMAVNVAELEEVVVTGYTSERKADIVGSVSVVNTENMLTAPAANLQSQLQGRAAGVVISGDSRPGGGAKVRIRGFTSFGGSDPLYIVDGVPTTDPAKINPNDIESVQVLKDATAASIYGARAAQGVVIITTKQGKEGTLQLSYNGYVGSQKVPESSYYDVLNTEEYVEYLTRSTPTGTVHPVFGAAGSYTIPDYIVVSPSFKGGVAASDPRAAADMYDISNYGAAYQIMETSDGTNWFDEALRPAAIQSHQINASGGTAKSQYAMSLNYFDQDGSFKFTNYKRYALRANTTYTPKDWIKVGENLQFIYDKTEGNRTTGEGGPWGWAYRMVPYIPARDIGGGFGGNAVGQSGNATSPIATIYRSKDDYTEAYKVFGNAFLEIKPIEGLTVRTSFGIDYGNWFNKDITYRTYESSENTSITGLGTGFNYNLSWTWTNTAAYEKSFGQHTVKVLAGTEAVKYMGNGINVSTNTFDFEDPNFINLNTDQTPTPAASSNQPIPETLASYFGRVDYIYNDRYLFNATIRRDGTSKIYETERWGTFPAFGAGWRVSEESFMSGLSFLDDLKIRGGWGQMGSIRNVNAGNQFTLFGSNAGISNYDINRGQNSTVVGYTPYRAGSLDTKWEFSETTNVGFDATFIQGKIEATFDFFINNTVDLLVNRVKNGVEPQVYQPAINLGKMQNKGIELTLTNRGQFGDLQYDLTWLFTHYKNEVVDIDGKEGTEFLRGGDRLNNIVKTTKGQPVSMFWGYELDGFFDDAAEVASLNQDGAVIGGWKYKDRDGDGAITSDDQTYLGSPHPDFITSLNLDLRYKNFDFNMFLVWQQGNELFDNTKYFTDMRVFVGAVSKRVLNDGWEPGANNSNARLPYLGKGSADDPSGYTSFTNGTSNSFYVSDGSFMRMKTMQFGYNVPKSMLSNVGIGNVRIYVQGQNLFTLTKYEGADPDISIQGDGDDLRIGVDRGHFPAMRQLLVGLNISL